MNQPPFYRAADDPGGFAATTLAQRLPHIIAQVRADPSFPHEARSHLDSLEAEVANGVVAHSLDIEENERPFWRDFFDAYASLSYAQVPFFALEAYFYRALLQCVGAGTDAAKMLFHQQKQTALLDGITDMAQLSKSLRQEQRTSPKFLSTMLEASLHGNAADLSQMVVGRAGNVRQDHLLHDDRSRVQEYMSQAQERVDILVDNAGNELHADLELALWLLDHGVAGTVYLHLKRYPTFVSDATIGDVHEHLHYLSTAPHQVLNRMAEAVNALVDIDRLRLVDHPFWNSPEHFTRLPADLRTHLGRSGLIISKGDANYRRFFEDRRWPVETDPDTLLDYLPAPTLLLRMLKSELALGLTNERAMALDQQDPAWRVNGTFGLMFFHVPGTMS